MRKPVVDYSGFRLSKLNTPEYSHLKWLSGWIFYFIMYFITENLIPESWLHEIHSPVDDIIPFCEYFVIFYVFWYVLIVLSLLYFALYNPKGFKQLQFFIIITQVVAMAIYIIYPSIQNLRPAEFERNNIFTFTLGIIYAFDTPTGVYPSLHVAYSLGIMSVWLKEKQAKPVFKAVIVILTVLISISVMFVKQHSFDDVLLALPLGLLAEIIVFGKPYWKPKLKKSLRKNTRLQ